MATTAKKSAPARSTAIVPWEAEMAGFAKKQAASEKPMGMFKQVAVNGGVMIIDDKQVPGNAIKAIILASTHENQWYDKPYNPNVPTVPRCFAFGDVNAEDPEAEMEPHIDADDRQGYPLDDKGELDKSSGEPPLCRNCWANRMGTADVGKGKACKNIRRQILTTEDALESPEAMKEAEARMFKVPVMSVGNWVNYVHECEDTYKRPYWGTVATVKVVPDQKSQWKIQYLFEELIDFDAALYAATKKRAEQANKDLLSPYPKLEEQEAPPARGRGAPAKAPVGPATRKKSKY